MAEWTVHGMNKPTRTMIEKAGLGPAADALQQKRRRLRDEVNSWRDSRGFSPMPERPTLSPEDSAKYNKLINKINP